MKNTIGKKLFYAVCIFILAIAVYNIWPEQKLAADAKIDFLLVEKSKRTMKAYRGTQLLKTYKISLGRNPIGHKIFEGDEKTPEGIYSINDRNTHSGYHKNLGVSYPNSTDREKAKAIGKSPGGDIKIHGLKNGAFGMINKLHRLTDWTNGCIAITNSEVDELFVAVASNTKIEIRP